MSFVNYDYSQSGTRYVMYPMPLNYDDWGLNENGEPWVHSACVIDDFGNAVPVDGFDYQNEDYVPYWAPDYANEPHPGQAYKYAVHHQLPH